MSFRYFRSIQSEKNGFLTTTKNRQFFFIIPPLLGFRVTQSCAYIPPANVTEHCTNVESIRPSVRSFLFSTHIQTWHLMEGGNRHTHTTDTFVRDMVRVMMADGRAHENSLQMSRRLFVRKGKEEKRERENRDAIEYIILPHNRPTDTQQQQS